MAYLALAALIRLLAVAAQDSAENESVAFIFRDEVSAKNCFRIKQQMNSGIPERRAYSVQPLTLTLSLPQDTKHLAQAVYDDTTPCREFLFRTLQPWSYGSALRLEFVDFDSPRAWGLTYHSCTDTTWEATVDFTSGSTTVGPVPTYTVVYNPCDTPQMFELNMTVTEGAPAEEYCNRLETQNDGDAILRWTILIGNIIALVLGINAWCMCTKCCTCCCCCARPGWCNKISTPCSRGCFRCWGNLVTRGGCGWIIGKAGGMRFYTENQSTSLLFWSFAASCMYAIVSILFPQVERDDTINPQFGSTRDTWGSSSDSLAPFFPDNGALQFTVALQFAIYNAVSPFVAMVLNFSDPLRDRSFQSKAIFCGILLFLTSALMVVGVTDSWRYYELWEYPGHQIVLQLGLFLTQSMTLLSYIHLIWRTTRQRSAVKRAHGGKLPFLLPETDVTGDAPNENIPVAEVVRTDTAFDGEQPSTQDNMNSHTDRSVPAMNTARNPAFEASPPTSEPHLQEMDTSVRVQQQDGSVVTAPGPVAEAAMDRKQESYSSFDNMPKGIMLPADIPESAEVTAAEAEKSRRGVKGFLKRQWESVCEDPSIGFKYSVFVSASLLLAFINLTATFLRTLHWVWKLAECTEEDSTCLRDIQLWFYRRFVSSLVKVDVETLELQVSGACGLAPALSATATGNSSTADPLLSQIAGTCEAVQLLESAQGEPWNPEWISNATAPILIGGHIGFVVAYCLGLYTIFHVARAYKKLELKLRAAKLAELLFQRRSMDLTELRSAASSSTAYIVGGTAKHKLGKNILDDYRTVGIAQSAYFVGTLVSTVQVQLVMAGIFMMGLMGTLIHPNFWQFVGQYYWWPVSFMIVGLWHLISQKLLNKFVTDGKRIKRPFLWLFLYVGLSAAYCMVGLLIAFFRLVWLMVTSIVALSRLDACLFTVMKGRDAGYASFLAMALMLHALKDCLSERNVTKDSKNTENPPEKKSPDALASVAVQAWKRSASSSAAQGGQQGDQPTEIQISNF